MPQFVDKRTGQKIQFGEAAKAFRASGKLAPDVAGLDDDSLIKRMAQDYSNAYGVEADVPAKGAAPPSARPETIHISGSRDFKLTPQPTIKLPASREEASGGSTPIDVEQPTGSKLNRGATTLEEVEKMDPANAAWAVTKNFVRGGANTVSDIGGMAYNAVTKSPDWIKRKFDESSEINAMGEWLAKQHPSDPGYKEEYAKWEQMIRDSAAPNLNSIGRGMVDSYKDRYGGWDSIKRTLVEDPFGAASDVSTIFTLGAGAARGAASLAAKTANAATTGGKIARAATAVESGARAVDPLLRTAATFTDPVSMVTEGARKVYGSKTLREGIAKPLYKFGAAIQDQNPMRVDAAVNAGIGPDGLPLNLRPETRMHPDYFDKDTNTLIPGTPYKTAWPTRLYNQLREVVGDAPIPESIENFKLKHIEPAIARRGEIVNELMAQGKFADGRTIIKNMEDELFSDWGVSAADFKDVNEPKLRRELMLRRMEYPGLGAIDQSPADLAEMLSQMNAAMKNKLDKYAKVGGVPEGERASTIVDNVIRRQVKRALAEMSPEFNNIGNDLAAKIRLAEQAEVVRGTRPRTLREFDDKIINMAPSELYGFLGLATGQGNMLANFAKASASALNRLGPAQIPRLARYLYRDPKTKDLSQLLLRQAGYNAADANRVLAEQEGEGDRQIEASGIHRPRTPEDIQYGIAIDPKKRNANVPMANQRPPEVRKKTPTDLPEKLWP